MRNPRSILITGASSGIGEALARAYAAPGVALHLSGRDPDRLESVAIACRGAGADARGAVADVVDGAAMREWIRDADARFPLDLVIANAGISGGTGGAGEADDQVRAIFAVNVDGVANTVLPAVALMRPRKRGQIAVMSSLAGFRGMPGAPAYCASKAAVRSWGEGLRGSLHRSGIEVSVICPGFVHSRMTARNRFPMPMIMDADRAARIIKRGLARNRGRIAFPLTLYALVRLVSALPTAAVDPLTRTLPDKD